MAERELNLAANPVMGMDRHIRQRPWSPRRWPIGAKVRAAAILFVAVACDYGFSLRSGRLWTFLEALLVPAEGFEPPTYGLQNRCTTTVLSRRRRRALYRGRLRRRIFVSQEVDRRLVQLGPQ